MVTRGLIEVRDRIASAAKRSGRQPKNVTLLAVAKGRSNASVREMYEAGQRVFGENRPQGLLQRLDGDLPGDIVWHFVGNVQRRAIKTIAPPIALLHSLDRMSNRYYGIGPVPVHAVILLACFHHPNVLIIIQH